MQSLARRGASSIVVQAVAYSLLDQSLDDIDRWIRFKFVYRPEIEEIVRTPQFMLKQLDEQGIFEGDCDDISTLYASLLKALHYAVRFVAIRYDNTPDFKHVFIEAWTGAGWRALDPTVAPGTPYHEIERMEVSV